jgi:hypothetical protein
MLGYRIVVEPRGVSESREWPATVALLSRGADVEDARDELAHLADIIEQTGGLPVAWDVAWPVPAAVLARHRNSVRIRCDSFERETDTGMTEGIGYLRISVFEEVRE